DALRSLHRPDARHRARRSVAPARDRRAVVHLPRTARLAGTEARPAHVSLARSRRSLELRLTATSGCVGRVTPPAEQVAELPRFGVAVCASILLHFVGQEGCRYDQTTYSWVGCRRRLHDAEPGRPIEAVRIRTKAGGSANRFRSNLGEGSGRSEPERSSSVV